MKETLISALKVAGEVLLNHFGKPVETRIKESQSSIVTQADLKSELLIVNHIRKRYPFHNIISEESGYTNNNSDFTWVIDPLDGTSNFASALPWFGVLISLFKNDNPIMGGAYLPINDILYFAEKDKGAFKNGKRFSMISNTDLASSLISFSVDYTEDDHFLNKSVEIYRNIVKSARNIRSTNSLVDFIYVAEGKLGGCINLFTKIWDISSPGLIISEAGGVMTDIKGEKIKFNLNEDIINTNFPVIAGSYNIVKSVRTIMG
jgi:myo-inositol-1(or 4)-monophosphatase